MVCPKGPVGPRVSRTGIWVFGRPGFGDRAMFESLSNRFNDVFDRLRGRGALSEGDIDSAMREIRVALLEADVALPVD